MPFLSLLDDRAKPKGSRDPLGFELVWTRFGRRVIGNLTTVTSSLNGFATALLGFAWANELHRSLPPDKRLFRIRETFLRYEQLAAYLRCMGGDKEILGITRVSKGVKNSDRPLSFGLGPEQQILSDQTSYGLWGLYTTALNETGLIAKDERTPTDDPGWKLASEMETDLDKKALLDMLSSDNHYRLQALQPHVEPFKKALTREPSRTQLLCALMNGKHSEGVQQELWRVTQKINRDVLEGLDIPSFFANCRKYTDHEPLIAKLTQIEYVERLLVAANNVFNYCRRKDGVPFEEVLNVLNNRYNFAYLPEPRDLKLANVPRAEMLSEIHRQFFANNMEEAVKRILELHVHVMRQRGGAPWVEADHDQTLRVRVPSETARLLSQDELKIRWDYEYFFSSFLRIARRAGK